MSFMKVTTKTKMLKDQKNYNSSDNESECEVSDFVSSEDSFDEWLP